MNENGGTGKTSNRGHFTKDASLFASAGRNASCPDTVLNFADLGGVPTRECREPAPRETRILRIPRGGLRDPGSLNELRRASLANKLSFLLMTPQHPDRHVATSARIYDYFLGGTHNFPPDREAAAKALAMFPDIPAAARANRAFLRQAVRLMVDGGVRQFLDLGSGIPTEGNVHEIAQAVVPDVRVVYVDTDTVAVAESLELLEGNKHATAIRADLRKPQDILANEKLQALLDFDKPVGLLLVAVMHFVPDDDEAYGAVEQLTSMLAPGSYMAMSHTAAEVFAVEDKKVQDVQEMFRRKTAGQVKSRTREEVARFFEPRFELIDPGIVYVTEWPLPSDDPSRVVGEPLRSNGWVAIGRISR